MSGRPPPSLASLGRAKTTRSAPVGGFDAADGSDGPPRVASMPIVEDEPKVRSVLRMDPTFGLAGTATSAAHGIGHARDVRSSPQTPATEETEDVIDKASFFAAKSPPEEVEEEKVKASSTDVEGKTDDVELCREWPVRDETLRPIPPYYPLEKSCRFIIDKSAPDVARGVQDCCRLMSVKAEFDHITGTALLYTAEHLEIHVSLWRGYTPPPSRQSCIVVETQRRRGPAVLFYKYSRHILDAAMGEFKHDRFVAAEDREKADYALAEQLLEQKTPKASTDREHIVLALEIAATLIRKDRLDARQLGMETLCLLTDPVRTGLENAVIASRVVLLGSAPEEGREEDEDYVPDELGIRNMVLGLVLHGRISEDGGFADSGEDSDDDNDLLGFNYLLPNLALSVLANALNVLEEYSTRVVQVGETKASVAEDCIDETKEMSKRDLLSTLLNLLNQAPSKPHDAFLSARCLRSLCDASKQARKQARDLDVKKVLTAALDVGRRTHVKLETECRKVEAVLLRNADDEDEDNRH